VDLQIFEPDVAMAQLFRLMYQPRWCLLFSCFVEIAIFVVPELSVWGAG
jgi:hypothetical protein